MLLTQLLLGRLDLLSGLLQMVLLKPDAVFEEIALLFKACQLLAVPVVQPFLFFAQAPFAFLDAALEIDLDLRPQGVELAARRFKFRLHAKPFLLDLLNLDLFELRQLVGKPLPFRLQLLVFVFENFPLGGQLRLERLALAAQLVKLALAN